MKAVREYCLSLIDKELMPTAFKTAVVVGSILFVLNHGSATLKGQMSRERWISAALTYIVPYMVNIHGQYISRARKR
ncbi:nitrate/nitrite transporter NrtS [Calothrix sp. FACHB-1219]|uniref:nitrate/nitrite transporter NrtS n=1 Tax=unclassified Calothrix TaxID=2619626 RepID=UPI00168773A8|nr:MULTISPECIES: nitrate/nitrite transporter NrtS [unclassified Calothrix]MBD2207156.1 nitrate/nitrite transporter NrtS [Calothrix sp. FACHB-168]MBD2221813.1 nitrate/nitrite transporter NrtS [Calothrix sp. FACHB-1219]